MGLDFLVNYGIKASVVPPASGYYELLHDSGSIDPGTSYTIPNLNITKTDNVVLQVFIPAGAETTLQLGFNGNTTLTNYYAQRILVDGTSFNNTRGNNPYFGYSSSTPSQGNMATIKIKIENNGRVTAYSQNTSFPGTSNVRIWDATIASTFTVTSITSITVFTAFASNDNLPAGSRFQLYKVRD